MASKVPQEVSELKRLCKLACKALGFKFERMEWRSVGCSSKSEVVRRAIALLKTVVDKRAEGCGLFLEHRDGTRTEVVL